MNQRQACSHKISLQVSEDTPFDKICDECTEKILNFSDNLRSIFQNEGNYMLKADKGEEVDMSWEINLLESPSRLIQPPLHLMNYIHSNLNNQNSESEFLAVKIFRKGVQILRSYLPESEFSLEMIPMSIVRNKIGGESLKLIDHSGNLSYQLLGEGDTSLYLSIQFENPNHLFTELSVRRNGRLIHSQKIDSSSTGVSGLVIGEYLITLSGREASRVLKIQVVEN